jgi:hypothetical protein
MVSVHTLCAINVLSLFSVPEQSWKAVDPRACCVLFCVHLESLLMVCTSDLVSLLTFCLTVLPVPHESCGLSLSFRLHQFLSLAF